MNFRVRSCGRDSESQVRAYDDEFRSACMVKGEEDKHWLSCEMHTY